MGSHASVDGLVADLRHLADDLGRAGDGLGAVREGCRQVAARAGATGLTAVAARIAEIGQQVEAMQARAATLTTTAQQQVTMAGGVAHADSPSRAQADLTTLSDASERMCGEILVLIEALTRLQHEIAITLRGSHPHALAGLVQRTLEHLAASGRTGRHIQSLAHEMSTTATHLGSTTTRTDTHAPGPTPPTEPPPSPSPSPIGEWRDPPPRSWGDPFNHDYERHVRRLTGGPDDDREFLLTHNGITVWFDAALTDDNGTPTTLIEAKGHYAQFLTDDATDWQPWWTGAEALLLQARRQVAAAHGVPVEWWCSEHAVARHLRQIFSRTPGLTGRIRAAHRPLVEE